MSGYSTVGANGARAWRFTAGTGTVDLGSFGGADSRALGINDASQVAGTSSSLSIDTHAFLCTDVTGSAWGAFKIAI